MTGKLTLLRGLPGSGKSTEVQRMQMTVGGSNLGRDVIRDILFTRQGQRFSRAQENEVTETQRDLVARALRNGTNVYVDEMLLKSAYLRKWIEFAGAEAAEYQIVDLTNVPLQTCLAQNKMRPHEKWVPEDVIRDLHRRFIHKQPYPLPVPELHVTDGKRFALGAIPQYSPDPTKPEAVMVDLDGTFAIIGDRSPYAGELCAVDLPRHFLHRLVKMLHANGVRIIFCSGRNDKARSATNQWIFKHTGMVAEFDYDLLMRADGDGRKDSIVKLELFWRQIAPHFNVLAVFDDRQQVVDAWRSVGLTDVYQVASGNF
jgi:predicted kinase